jgi:hypothetical protein
VTSAWNDDERRGIHHTHEEGCRGGSVVLGSLALQVMVVSPSGKLPPEAGAQVTGTGPSTTSLAVGSV